MADAPGTLGDFFAKKKKKHIKGSNLNVEAAPKVEEKKAKAKDKDEDGWEEEQIVAPTMKVEVAGKLMREDEKKDDDDTVAPAWGTKKVREEDRKDDKFEKKFPTLQKAVGASSNINLDDGSEPKVNIKTSKNAFSALDSQHDDDEDGPKRPKEIKPAMVQKQKGEREKVAIQREVDKYSTKKDDGKKAAAEAPKKKAKEEDEEEAEDDAEEKAEEDTAAKKRKEKAKEPVAKVEAPQPAEVEEDLKILPDPEASKAKYQGRVKLPLKQLPASELEEGKENRPIQVKKPKKMFVEEEVERQIKVADWDD